jgi:hypothetical protein
MRLLKACDWSASMFECGEADGMGLISASAVRHRPQPCWFAPATGARDQSSYQLFNESISKYPFSLPEFSL